MVQQHSYAGSRDRPSGLAAIPMAQHCTRHVGRPSLQPVTAFHGTAQCRTRNLFETACHYVPRNVRSKFTSANLEFFASVTTSHACLYAICPKVPKTNDRARFSVCHADHRAFFDAFKVPHLSRETQIAALMRVYDTLGTYSHGRAPDVCDMPQIRPICAACHATKMCTAPDTHIRSARGATASFSHRVTVSMEGSEERFAT